MSLGRLQYQVASPNNKHTGGAHTIVFYRLVIRCIGWAVITGR